MAETGNRNDPFAAFNFILEIDEVAVAGFSECTGLNTETDLIEYRTGNEEPTDHKIPGKIKYGPITLKRGLVDRKMWDWRKTVLDGRTVRHSGSIALLDEARNVAFHALSCRKSSVERPVSGPGPFRIMNGSRDIRNIDGQGRSLQPLSPVTKHHGN